MISILQIIGFFANCFATIVFCFMLTNLYKEISKLKEEKDKDIGLVINVFKAINKEQEIVSQTLTKNTNDIAAHEGMLYVIDEELNLGLYAEDEVENNPPDSKNNLN